MIASEFAQIFEDYPNIKKHFIGCFSADTIPKKIKPFHFAVINTDLSSNPGIHWYCCLRYKSKLEIFDSLGISEPSRKTFLKVHFQLPGIKEIEFNTTQFQSNDSQTCGRFVCYFVIQRLYNMDHSFKNILNLIFLPSLSENEQEVKKFFDGEQDY